MRVEFPTLYWVSMPLFRSRHKVVADICKVSWACLQVRSGTRSSSRLGLMSIFITMVFTDLHAPFKRVATQIHPPEEVSDVS